ncbi:hypothetical protein BTR22_05685 [Alkalihalophilus pseudofirmus]|uniref:DUF2515 domain-containing protein n=1 Tax=Alkalihalophilus pseudofirmus TaxID=79885 RepID=UPI000952AE32|nr:hypothetical protein BTR22_05685 [Alkalihalophilus pseudofirmus]
MTISTNELQLIKKSVEKHNRDNISRTKAYERFYERNPEIRWAMLAGIVSRNAGWNMTDLSSKWFQGILDKNSRATIFAMYERANWIIFQDAYPQLLLYEWAKKKQLPVFEQLKTFHVSEFMRQEWEIFWEARDEVRLCTSLIINEQQLLELEVMSSGLFQKNVFHTLRYQLEEHAHFSYVLLPTMNGSIYGQYVRNFTHVNQRIELGKRLAMILFHPVVHKDILQFTRKVEHTGSRRDYEQICDITSPNTSPMLRVLHPVYHHKPPKGLDWFSSRKPLSPLFKRVKETRPEEIREWVHTKRVELYWIYKWGQLTMHK